MIILLVIKSDYCELLKAVKLGYFTSLKLAFKLDFLTTVKHKISLYKQEGEMFELTLALSIKVPNFIIMGIDSMETHFDNDQYLFQNENSDKIHILPNGNVVSFAGSLSICELNEQRNTVIRKVKDIKDIIDDLKKHPNSQKMTISQTIYYFIEKFKDFNEFNTQIHLGGIQEDGELTLKRLTFKNGKLVGGKESTIEARFGCYYNGSDMEQIWRNMIRVSGLDMNTKPSDPFLCDFYFASHRKDELIFFLNEVISNVIAENKGKPIEKQSVGGNINIVQITKDQTLWVSKRGVINLPVILEETEMKLYYKSNLIK